MFLITVLVLSLLPPVFSYPDLSVDVVITTDKQSYRTGELVTIKGTGGHGYTIVAKIISPNGNLIDELEFFSKSNGDFSTVWMIPRGLVEGTYVVQVTDSIKEDQTSIEIVLPSTQNKNPAPTPSTIPVWVKNVAKFWVNDMIDDSGFIQVIEYLVQNNIIVIPNAKEPQEEGAAQIPTWIKINAGYWTHDQISDDEFALGLEWLINNGMIKVRI